jgi:phage terminase large subunit-like protein
MKMADILRNIADLLDQNDNDDSSDISGNSTQKKLTPVKPVEPELDDNPVMVPPLQAKLEILKKSEGIPNIYSDNDNDELSLMKKRAGISTAQKEASEDNDITG